MLVGLCFTATEKSLKELFDISLDLYLGHSIIVVLLDSNIKRLASSTAFIPDLSYSDQAGTRLLRGEKRRAKK